MLRKGRDYHNDYRFTCPVCKGAGVLRRVGRPIYKGDTPRIYAVKCDICYGGEVEEVPTRVNKIRRP